MAALRQFWMSDFVGKIALTLALSWGCLLIVSFGAEKMLFTLPVSGMFRSPFAVIT
jgi:hypothetical protein